MSLALLTEAYTLATVYNCPCPSYTGHSTPTRRRHLWLYRKQPPSSLPQLNMPSRYFAARAASLHADQAVWWAFACRIVVPSLSNESSSDLAFPLPPPAPLLTGTPLRRPCLSPSYRIHSNLTSASRAAVRTTPCKQAEDFDLWKKGCFKTSVGDVHMACCGLLQSSAAAVQSIACPGNPQRRRTSKTPCELNPS